MSWAALLVIAAAIYAMKAVAPVLLGPRELGDRTRGVLDLVAVPLLAALIAVQTLDGGKEIVADPRLPALGVAALLVWRRAPFLVVVIAAAATAALIRAV